MQEGNEGSPLSALDDCADFVHSQSIKRTRQGTLDKFFWQWLLGTKSWKVSTRIFVVWIKCYITFKYQIFSLIYCVFCFNRIRLEDFKDNRRVLGQVINYVDIDDVGKMETVQRE
jgi:hypothetical protein